MARIFVVDDSLMIRTLLREIFNEAGHEVVGEARDGVAAEQEVRGLASDPTRRPDVVTLNLIMPVRGGMDTLPALRAIDPGIAVVICSASLDRRRVVRAIRLGAAGFILKPFTRESALAGLDSALAHTGDITTVSWQSSITSPLAELAEDASDERREFVRADVRRMVRIMPETRPPFSTTTVDISGGGMLIESGRLEVGEAVDFLIELGSLHPPVHGRAHVVRVDHLGRPGLAFAQVSVGDHERLVDFLHRQTDSAVA